MKLKYVIINESFPVVFGEYFEHSDFTHMGVITSAGFCSIDKIKTDHDKYPRVYTSEMIEVYCYGESVSLGVKSAPESDKYLIQAMYNN